MCSSPSPRPRGDERKEGRYPRPPSCSSMLVEVPVLTFRVLEALPRTLVAILLPFLDARVPGEKPCLTQGGPELRVQNQQRPRDAMTDRARLAGHSAAGDVGDDIEAPFEVGDDQRLPDRRPQWPLGEILVGGPTVDHDRPIPRRHADPGDRLLPASRGRNRSLSLDHASRSWRCGHWSAAGCWAVCRWSPPR